MNTIAIHLPSKKNAKADMLVAPFSALYQQRSQVRVWAFSAAVRLSDQNRPIVLKLLVELAIVLRMLALLAQTVRCATGKTVIAHRAHRPRAVAASQRGIAVKRTSALNGRHARAVRTARVEMARKHSELISAIDLQSMPRPGTLNLRLTEYHHQ